MSGERSGAGAAGRGGEEPARQDGDERAERGWFGRHQRAAWISAGAVVVGALITTVVPLFASPGSDPTSGAPPAPTTSGPTAASTAPSPSPPASGHTRVPEPRPSRSAPPGGSERWRGSLLLDAVPKDLDADQPGTGSSEETDVYITGYEPPYEIEGWNGTVISLLPGGAADPPGFAECASTVTAAGADVQPLSEAAVLCVRTSEGDIARLTPTSLAAGIDRRTTFDAVVWHGS